MKAIEFTYYVQPNAALDAGDLDANSFQHQPYRDSQVKQRGYKIVNAGLTYISPLGVYSKKLKSLKALPPGAKVPCRTIRRTRIARFCCCRRRR